VKNRQTDTQTNGCENLTTATAVGVGKKQEAANRANDTVFVA